MRFGEQLAERTVIVAALRGEVLRQICPQAVVLLVHESDDETLDMLYGTDARVVYQFESQGGEGFAQGLACGLRERGGKFGPSEFDRQGRQSETFQYAPYDHDATVAHHVFDVYVTVCFHKNVQPMVYKDSERRAQRQMKTKFSGLAMPSRILSSWEQR